MTNPLHLSTSNEVSSQAATKVCRRCRRELPATLDYFRTGGQWGGLRGHCKRCQTELGSERRRGNSAAAAAAKSAPGRFAPRVVGDGGPEGGYTEFRSEGYRFCCIPDTHGDKIDWPAAEAALAFVRYYRPALVVCLGDHVDFEAISRFRKHPDRVLRMHDDIAAAKKFLGRVRESAPGARILYLKGNHEARFAYYLWEKAAALLNLEGMDLPHVLGLGEQSIEWVESGTHELSARLIAKHGHMVRSRSAYTATGEMERNGISGISGHTHRLGVAYKTNRLGTHVWIESGCLCSLKPDYMEGQVADWQHGMSFGTVSLKGHSFTAHAAPIINGRVMAAGMEVGP